MKFGSVCSGIEAASVAWGPLGWKAAWFSEIEPFPCAVLKHHYPDVPNLGDMTTLPARVLAGEVEAPDLFCGGTPCQAFSVAGLRRSLDDARGNLSLTFCEIANAIDHQRTVCGEQPCIVFWENVVGVLSTKDNAFGCFLAGLAGEDEALVPPGGRWTNAGFIDGPQRAVAWRVLDAQYFGVAQRRRRVFVVASARADFDPAAVLFEWDGVRRDSAPSRQAGQKPAPTIAGCANGGGANWPGRDVDSVESLQPVIAPPIAETPIASDHKGPGHNRDHNFIAHSLRGEGFDASEDGMGRGTPLVPAVAFVDVGATLKGGSGARGYSDPSDGNGHNIVAQSVMQPVAVPMVNMQGSKGNAVAQADGPSFTLNAMHGHDVHAIAVRTANTSANGHGISPELAHTLDQAQGQAVAFHENQRAEVTMNDTAGSLKVGGGKPGQGYPAVMQAVAVDTYNGTITGELAATISARNGIPDATGPRVMAAMQVRRLTPIECERLQGFPDDYTAIPWRGKPAAECPDGPRYKALGNSWAVPVVRWIGERIERSLA